MTHTKDILRGELRKIGLNRMAEIAATGYYHDYLSPLLYPEMQLSEDLARRNIRGDGSSNAAFERWVRRDEKRERRLGDEP